METRSMYVSSDAFALINVVVSAVITPTFTSGKLKHIFPLIMELADDTLQTLQAKFEANEHVDLKKFF